MPRTTSAAQKTTLLTNILDKLSLARPEGEISDLGGQLLDMLFQNASKVKKDVFSSGDREVDEFQIPTTNILKNIPGLKTVKRLRETLESLAVKVRYTAVDVEGKKRDGFLIPLVQAETDENEGICRYAFSRRLPKLMADPEFKAEMNPSLKRRKGSKYGRLIYKLCLESQENGQTPFIAVEELKNYLEAPKNSYPEFKIFNRDVLKPALKEINEQTDLTVKLITRKTGRKITSVGFGVSTKVDKPLAPPLVFSRDEPKSKAGREEETANQKLVSMGVSKELAKQLSQIYNVEYLSFAVSVLNKYRENKFGGKKEPNADEILLKIIKLRQKRLTTQQEPSARTAAKTGSEKQIDELYKAIANQIKYLGRTKRKVVKNLLAGQKS